MLLSFQRLDAQTWEEWFQQKKTRIKYLNEQIAANKSFFETLKKGYEVVAGGLELAESIRQEEFDLHNGFFESLRTLNPKLEGYARIADIIKLSVAGYSEIKAIKTLISEENVFAKSEKNFILKITPNIYEDISGNLDLFKVLVSEKGLSVSDSKRLVKIDEVYLRILETVKILKCQRNSLVLLAVHRKAEQAEINYSKILNQLR